MAVRDSKKYVTYSGGDYIYGNTVRKENEVPDERIERRKKENIRRNRQRQLQVNFGYTLFLLTAVIASLFVCIKYIQIRAEATNSMKRITSLENELIELKDDNDITYNRLLTSVDLNEIKRIAIEEYGMVYAGENQIITYQTDSDDYMYQYMDVSE